ncbi:MAG: hypothetical protein EOO73_01410 [Myxococcales bacterium]|nr:MAG: hypothetical protein EOO73_01410 [Myxococcales bacterium]
MTAHACSRARLPLLLGLLIGSVDGGTLQASEHAAVSIGDVHVSRESGAGGEALKELKAALSMELGRTRLGSVKRPLIVSATLTQLSSERRDERTKTSATISIALSRAEDRVLFAEIRGKASVEEASGNVASVRRAALEGAVHGAFARLPEAIRRSR